MIKKAILGVLISLFLFGLVLIGAVFYSFKIIEKGELVLTEDWVEFPYSYTSSGHVRIDVEIHGKIHPFIVDTGASNILFSDEQNLLDRFKGFGLGRDSNGAFFLSTIKSIDSISIGGLQGVDLRFELVKSTISCPDEAIGIIGKETLRQSVWQFFPNRKIIRVAVNSDHILHTESEDTVSLSVNKFGHQLSTFISLDERGSNKFLVDTGFNGSISTSLDSTWSRADGLQVFGIASRGLASVDSTDNFLFQIKKLQMLGCLIDDTITVQVSNRRFKAIGLGVLEEFNYAFDWKKKRMFLDPLPDQRFTWKSFGLNFDLAGGDVVVSSIIQDSWAHQDGVRVGQKIFNINGEDLGSISSKCELKRIRNEGNALKLSYIQDEKLKTVELQKQNLFKPE